MIENELVYLVAAMPDVAGAKSKEIAQHYFFDGSNLRMRAADGAYEMTRKISMGGDGTRKEEINIPLAKEEYEAFLPITNRSLEKTRHFLPLAGGLVAELNVYKGPLQGLVMVEVEFPSDEARAAFVPPEWFGRNVSTEDWSSNSRLAGKTFADIKTHIENPA